MSAPLPPIVYRWNGEAMEPLPRFHNICNAELTVGQTYTLVEHLERSRASHGHFFALVHEAFANLPEHLHAQFPTEVALRKYALIKAGFCDVQTFPCGSRAEALRWAERLRPLDPYSIVVVTGSVVTRYSAQSQAEKAMDRKAFQDSKDKVLGILADLINVSPADLARETGRAA